MVGIMFIIAGIALLATAYCIFTLNKKVKKLEEQLNNK